MYHHAAMGIKNSINRTGQTIVEPFDKRGPTAMALNAGEFSLHHELAVHRSAPNHAAHRRIGIGLNYLPPHVRVNSAVRLKAMLVRGEDRHGTSTWSAAYRRARRSSSPPTRRSATATAKTTRSRSSAMTSFAEAPRPIWGRRAVPTSSRRTAASRRHT